MKNNVNKRLNSYFLGHPKPLFSLFLSELWERFSFYGIRPLLVLYITASLAENGLGIDRPTAAAIVGIFGGFIYLAPLAGGWLADNWLGQKMATFYGSLLMALGHLCIALSAWFGTTFFFLGLFLIVLGTGLFKTCISTIVGLLYKDGDERRDSGYLIFYMGINLGAFVAPLATGFLSENYGWHLGFGIGGIGMLVSLLIFYFKAMKDLNEFSQANDIEQSWEKPKDSTPNLPIYLILLVAILVVGFFLVASGVIAIDPIAISKNMITIISVSGLLYFIYLVVFSGLSSEERQNLFVLLGLLISAAIFWSTFEQQATTFNLFTKDFIDRKVLGFEVPTAWFQSINPLLIITTAPIIGSFWIYLSKKGIEINSFLKFALGLFLTAMGYIVMIFASKSLLANHGEAISMSWILWAYFFITMGELWLSPVGLSIANKIAPEKIKGQTMGLWFVSVALGNVVAGLYGGEVRSDNLEHLPDIFTQLTMILCITGIALVVLYFAILRKKNIKI